MVLFIASRTFWLLSGFDLFMFLYRDFILFLETLSRKDRVPNNALGFRLMMIESLILL